MVATLMTRALDVRSIDDYVLERPRKSVAVTQEAMTRPGSSPWLPVRHLHYTAAALDGSMIVESFTMTTF
jgi:hypothetical protein